MTREPFIKAGAENSGQKTGGVGPADGGFIMSEEFGSDYITITDDEGNAFELEHLDTFEHGDDLYMVFLPADMDEKDENYGLIILKVIEENGEEILTTIDDDLELETVYNAYMKMLFEAEEGLAASGEDAVLPEDDE